MITVLTAAQSTDLTTLDRVKASLKITTDDVARDTELSRLIGIASSAIEEIVGYPLRRERVLEQCQGTGRTTLVTERHPIAELEAVAHDDIGPITIDDTIRISNAKAGILWRETGWPNDPPVSVWLTADAQPQVGRQPWSLTLKTGYLLPGDSVMASGYSLAADGSMTAPLGTLVPLVAPGDIIRISGFATPGNNGRFPVVSRTGGAIVANAVFTPETGTIDAYLDVRTLPGELEQLCVESVKAWYFASGRDPAITSERIGDWSATYTIRGEGGIVGLLPPHVLQALDRWTSAL